MLTAQGAQMMHYIRSFADAFVPFFLLCSLVELTLVLPDVRNSRRHDIANERLPMFEPPSDGDYPVIPAPSMRRRGSNDLEELGMEIRKLDEEVDSVDMNMNMNMNMKHQQSHKRRSERVVETRRKVTTRTTTSKRYEGM